MYIYIPVNLIGYIKVYVHVNANSYSEDYSQVLCQYTGVKEYLLLHLYILEVFAAWSWECAEKFL